MGRNNDELDKILEEGLSTYSGGEPWPGLEDRVLSRVAGAGASKKRRIWRWMIVAVPAAACLLLAVSGLWRKQEVRPVERPPQVARVRPEPVPHEIEAQAVPAPRQRVTVRKSVAPASQSTKREQFPSPAPLSSEERALISLAMAAPSEQPTPGEPAPLEVEPIQIEPLQISGPSEEKIQ
jgi:hypothetical protein